MEAYVYKVHSINVLKFLVSSYKIFKSYHNNGLLPKFLLLLNGKLTQTPTNHNITNNQHGIAADGLF